MEITGEQDALIKYYIKEEKQKGAALSYLQTLFYVVKKFFHFLNEHAYSLSSFGVNEALEYQKWLQEQPGKNNKPLSNKTVRTDITVALLFFNYLRKKGKVITNPFKEIRLVRNERKFPYAVLKEKEIIQLLGMFGRFEEAKTTYEKIQLYRLHVIGELLYATGMRISEAGALTPEDVDFDRGTVYIRKGKGGKDRLCFLNEYTKGVLKIYLEEMRELLRHTGNREENIFTMEKSRMKKFVNEGVREFCRTAGMREVTAHGFRHAFALHLLRGGCDVRYIQEFLGHRHLKTTEIYTKIEKEDLKQMLDTYHPRTFRRAVHEDTHTGRA